MEKEILALLKQMNVKLDNLGNQVDRIEKKMDAVYDQTADLTEFRTEVIDKLNELKDIKEVTESNCFDIKLLKRRTKYNKTNA